MRARRFGRVLLVAAAVAATGPAAAQQGQQPQGQQPHAGGGQHGGGGHGMMGGAHGDAMRSAMQHMQRGMDVPMTGNPDIDFARMMIPHHRGAIDMARAQLEGGKDPELRRLAQEIIEAQEREIAFLEGWLERHGAR